MGRKYPIKDLKLLFGSASNLCSKCRKKLKKKEKRNDPATQTGVIAHIIAHKENGPRGDLNFPKEKLDTYENWILLCGDCHKEVDDQPNYYTPKMLREMKKEHEDLIEKKISRGIVEFGFPELKTVIRHISSGEYSSIENNGNLDLISINDKIKKNSLSNKTQGLITQGISRSNEVEKFFSKLSKTDIYIITEVQSQFKKKYVEIKNKFADGDVIFYEMLEFAQGGAIDYTEKSAGLSLLCYLFELCEVFEK